MRPPIADLVRMVNDALGGPPPPREPRAGKSSLWGARVPVQEDREIGAGALASEPLEVPRAEIRHTWHDWSAEALERLTAHPGLYAPAVALASFSPNPPPMVGGFFVYWYP